MALSPGTRLGPYEIVAPIGAGAMGEVYKARDTRLDRSVAIKVLPPEVGADADRRARFEREAKTIAGLNHPHICTLHDVGHDMPLSQAGGGGREAEAGSREAVHYLVMELLAGETLADRLEKGPLPLEQALTIAAEIGDALAAAHRQGVIHRDLKPANVMLTKSGAKLLDFGLAKLAGHGEQPAAASFASAPTATRPLTTEGAIVGTLQYMAPEQVEGKPADARTDLWALGAILYEMLTGKRAFEGASAASLIAAILEHEPAPVIATQPLTPPSLDRIVRKCLAKDPDARWQSAADVADELRWLAGTGSVPTTTAPTPRSSRRWALAASVFGVLLLALLSAAGGIAIWRRGGGATISDPMRVAMALSPSELTLETWMGGIALSPDGRTVVFVASRPDEQPLLWVRTLDDEEPRPLKGTEGASLPFFSFDGQEVAFKQNDALFRTALGGGTPHKICSAVEFLGGTWRRDGFIVYGGGSMKPGLWKVPDEGGDPTAVVEAPKTGSRAWYTFPDLLPDGKSILFTVDTGSRSTINVWSAATGRVTPIADGAHARYLPTGHLVYEAGEAVRVVGFDLRRLERIGTARTVVERTRTGPGFALWAVSQTALVYAPRYTGLSRLVWKDRGGKADTLPLNERPYMQPAISRRDGHRLAVSVLDDRNVTCILIGSTDQEPLQPLLPGQFSAMPSFTWDGKWVLFTGQDDNGAYNIFRASEDQSGVVEPLTDGNVPKGVATTSPGGDVLLLHTIEGKGYHLWEKRLDPRGLPLQPFVRSTSVPGEGCGRFSPDGHQVAYVSDDQVWVTEYPKGRTRQVSTNGGAWPVWNPRGGELFYQGRTGMMSVKFVKRTPQPAVQLFAFKTSARMLGSYDVSPDGERFLVVENAQSEEKPAQLHLVLNWLEERKAKVSAGK